MGRTPFCSADGLKKGAWASEEDQKLIAYIQKHGEGGWRSLPEKAGLQRCGKSCRLRWANYLRAGIKRGGFTSEEDQTIIELHAELGNRWAAIARHLPKRTDNDIKNYWNAHLKKRLANMGVDPVTHKPVVGSTTPGAGAGASSGGNSDSTTANADPKTHSESAKAQQSEPTLQQQPTTSRSRSTSASALLLNKLATRVTILQGFDPLRACQTLQPMSFNGNGGDGGANSIESTDKLSHPTSSFQINNNTSTTVAETSAYWLELDNNITDPLPTLPLNCLDLSNAVLSPQDSAEYGIAIDDGCSTVSVDTNIDYPPSSEPAAARCFSSTTSAGVLNNVASKFYSLRCINELNYWQNNNINLPEQQIQVDTDATTTDYGGLSGDINIVDDHMIFDPVGSPGFCNSKLC